MAAYKQVNYNDPDYLKKMDADGNTQQTSTENSGETSQQNTGAAQTGTTQTGGAAAQAQSLLAQMPNYQSKWSGQLDDLVGQILGREKFSYDLNADALYQQYANQYANMGKMAMMDTMGQAAQLTGGYGNSYAQGAGQQAYQGYLQQLNDRVPELYGLALDKYQMEGDNLLNQYSLLGAMDDQAYGRYMDYLNYLYQQGRDQIADQQWQAEFDENVRRFNFANNLGEFAPVAVPSYDVGSGYYGSPRPSQDEQNDEQNNEDEQGAQWADGISTSRNENGLKGSAWDYTKHNLSQLQATGNAAAANNYMEMIVDQLNEKQFNEAMQILNRK